MPEPTANKQTIKRMGVIASGALLLAGGLTLNYVLERHNIFKMWENSDYPISWADLFYPPVCVLLCLTGIGLSLGGAFHGNTIRKSVTYSAAVALPLAAVYALFVFGMQFIATGADRLGECPGLDQAATNANVIPESLWWQGRAAVGCGVERRGIFLSSYNDVAIYGVTDARAQQLIVDEVAKHYQQAHTHPVQLRFLEREKVSTLEGKKGVIIRKKVGPSKLIRIVNVG